MATIEEVLARLNPKTAQSFRVASSIENNTLPTSSLGINMAIKGIGYGRFTTLWGNRGCGKSLMAMQMVAEAQKEGKSTAWMDVEKNFDPSWARRLGANPDEILVDKNTISIAGMADKSHELIESGIDVLVVDSVSQLLPQSYFEDPKNGKEEVKGLAQTGQIGTFSKNLGQALDIINSINQNTAVILISQVRNNIGSYGASKSMMGGHALEHASSTIIKLWRTPSEIIEGEVHLGDGLLIKRPVGSPVTWTIEKNRGSGMHMSNTYDMYHTGDHVGVDVLSEIVNYGIEFGIIKKAAAWLSYEGGESFNGKPKFIEYLRDNEAIAEKIHGEILAKSI